VQAPARLPAPATARPPRASSPPPWEPRPTRTGDMPSRFRPPIADAAGEQRGTGEQPRESWRPAVPPISWPGGTREQPRHAAPSSPSMIAARTA
jgi:hypothetical protein